MSTPQIHEALAMLAQLKTMHAVKVSKPVPLVIPGRRPYVRTPEEQAQLDRVGEMIAEVERGRRP